MRDDSETQGIGFRLLKAVMGFTAAYMALEKVLGVNSAGATLIVALITAVIFFFLNPKIMGL